MTQVKVLEGYLRINEKQYGDATHVGQMNIGGKNYWLYGWFIEAELVDEYGKVENTKYFKLWTSDKSSYKPSKERLLNDANNVGFLAQNTERETHKHPVFKGEIKVNNSRFFLSCWKNSKKEMINGDLTIRTLFALKISAPHNNRYDDGITGEQEQDYSGVPF